MINHNMSGLNAYFESPAIAALWSDEALLAAMLRFELELARAQSAIGLMPDAHAHVIAQVVREQFSDAAALAKLASEVGRQARVASTLAIPLVDTLRAAVKQRDEAAAKHVHFGATSQDVVDSAMMLQAKASLHVMDAQLQRMGDALVKQITTHRHTPMMGRTLLQTAVPITFGFKAAVWLSGVARSRTALQAQAASLPLQLGGAAGSLHALSFKGQALQDELAKRLDLQSPRITWHAQRDVVARLGSELAILCGVLGKFGLDIALAMQNEVGELSEPHEAGRGASSAMAHKRNPVGAMHMAQAAAHAPQLAATLMHQQHAEHERALGNWQAQLFVLRDLVQLTGGALDAGVEVVEGLQVHAAQMLKNLQGASASESQAAEAMTDAMLSAWQQQS